MELKLKNISVSDAGKQNSTEKNGEWSIGGTELKWSDHFRILKLDSIK